MQFSNISSVKKNIPTSYSIESINESLNTNRNSWIYQWTILQGNGRIESLNNERRVEITWLSENTGDDYSELKCQVIIPENSGNNTYTYFMKIRVLA